MVNRFQFCLNFAFNFSLRRYTMALAFPLGALAVVVGGCLHSSNFQLNVSALYGTGGAFREHSGGAYGVSGGVRGSLGCVFVSETAQVELRSGRM